jgi:1-acyl-sn-glycerol-3-phosphate acyltransferase
MFKSHLFVGYFRGGRVACHIFYGIILGCFFPLLNRTIRQHIIKNWACSLLVILNIKLNVQGNDKRAIMDCPILVSNHISWLDVFALNAVFPSYFVAKSEVGDWPILGWMCHRAGTLFIRRTVRRDTARINREISSVIKRGESIALFPEGTSSDSGFPGHFHSSLLQVAVDLNVGIHPVAIRYHDSQGNTNTDAAFVGDMSFIQSLWKIICSPSLQVSLYYLPALSCEGKSRRLLATAAQQSIHSKLTQISPSHLVNLNCSIPSHELDVASSPV